MKDALYSEIVLREAVASEALIARGFFRKSCQHCNGKGSVPCKYFDPSRPQNALSNWPEEACPYCNYRGWSWESSSPDTPK